MKNREKGIDKKVLVAVAVVVIIVGLVLAILIIRDQKNKPEDYILEPTGGVVRSLENVVGKREMIESDKEILEDAEGMEKLIKYSYEYNTKNGKKDVEQYANFLHRRGFLAVTDYDFTLEENHILMVKEFDEKYYTTLFIAYKSNTIEVIIWEQEGTVEKELDLSNIDPKILKELMEENTIE